MVARRLKSLFWIGVDPILLRLGMRILSLQEQALRAKVAVAPPGVLLGEGVKLHPDAQLICPGDRTGSIEVGSYSHIEGKLQTFWDNGRISLGSHCYVGTGSQIWSQASIRIGNHVLISHLVDIHDTNSHPLSAAERRLDAQVILQNGAYRTPTTTQSAPIVIEDDVWISAKSTVLKGVTIGRGAIVAANSVVTHDVEPFAIVAGCPARKIGSAEE